MAGPIESYVGNTHPSTTVDSIAGVLENYALHHKVEEFKVEKVVPLTKEINPRSRS